MSSIYAPCVLGADGRCTRWSHDHAKHRADVPVDSCLTLRRLRVLGQCPACSYYEPRHRAGDRA